MLAAFFIATEPVSGPKNDWAKFCYGLGAGLLIYLIRTWGSYPDGSAFAILLMNLAVPALERLALRRRQAAP
ncbi:electron transport complex protein RnfD [compost metagenome]